MNGGEHRDRAAAAAGAATAGRLVGTRIEPAAVEQEFRAATLREDGRASAFLVGPIVLLSLPFVANDLLWAAPAGRLPEVMAARVAYLLSGLAVVVAGLRARRPRILDGAVLVHFLLLAAFMVVEQSTRPTDYYLPVVLNAIGILVALSVVPNRFGLQLVESAALGLAAVTWLVLFRAPPPRPVAMLIAFSLATAFLSGAFVSWRLHRSRRLQFLAIREEAEVASRLRASEDLFRTSFDGSPVGKAIADTSGTMLRANETFARMLGYTVPELVGLSSSELTHPDDRAASREGLYERPLHGEAQGHLEKRYLRRDGSVAVAEVTSSIIRGPAGEPLRLIAEIIDVTERRRTQEALSASRARYAQLYEGIGDGVASAEPDGRIVEFNDVFRRMLGYEAGELRALTYVQLTPERWHGPEAAILARAVETRAPAVTYEKEYRRKDGSIFPVELRVFIEYAGERPSRLWAVVRDISEPRALRDQLAVASRLATMGTLVAGMAHEINNPLSAAISAHAFAAGEVGRLAALLRSDGPLDPDPVAGRLDRVGEALADAAAGERRVSAIVKDLALLGRPEVNHTRVPLVRAVEEALHWIPGPLRGRADVRVENHDVPDAWGSEGQIVQVVANLLTNAIRAVPDAQTANVRVVLSPGEAGRARLEISDDGVGMTPEVMQRMFDPFYTTRPVGQGTGLGLAICHAIVSAHGGTIGCASEPGAGTTFRVELPAAGPP